MEKRIKFCPPEEPFSKTEELLEALRNRFRLKIKIFPLNNIPEAITWAERGNVAIHENYQSRRRKSYHIISADKQKLLRLCAELCIPETSVRSSDFYKFWHTSWSP